MRNKHCLKKNQKYLRLFLDCRSFPSVVCIVCRLGHQLMEWNHRNRKPFGRKACFKISSDSVVGFLYLAFCGLPTYIHLKDKMNTLNVMGRSQFCNWHLDQDVWLLKKIPVSFCFMKKLKKFVEFPSLFIGNASNTNEC